MKSKEKCPKCKTIQEFEWHEYAGDFDDWWAICPNCKYKWILEGADS